MTELQYNELVKKPLEVKQIFDDHFGEENVDLQVIDCEGKPAKLESLKDLSDDAEDADNPRFFILVRWSSVVVTNEYKESVTIYDLFARINITYEGTFSSFCLAKTTFTPDQYRSGYVHSHVPSVSLPRRNIVWQSPCLGTGPIRNTFASLAASFDKDLWWLCCLEIDKYVHTESVSGVPYFRLSSIGRSYGFLLWDRYSPLRECDYTTVGHYISSSTLLALQRLNFYSFVKYLLKKKVIKYKAVNDKLIVANDYIDFAVAVSNCFIDWVNMLLDKVKNKGEDNAVELIEQSSKECLYSAVLLGNSLYDDVRRSGQSFSPLEDNSDAHITFKDTEYYIKILGGDSERSTTIRLRLLPPQVISQLRFVINHVINTIDTNG